MAEEGTDVLIVERDTRSALLNDEGETAQADASVDHESQEEASATSAATVEATLSDEARIRRGIKDELLSYPRRELSEVTRQWKLMGLFGGHRGYLGHDLASTAMALTFGGLGAWWLVDRAKLSGMTDAWNAEQSSREEQGTAPQDVDGLVLAEPVLLDGRPDWADEEPGALEKGMTLLFTFPVLLTVKLMELQRSLLERIPVLGGLYGKLSDFQIWLTDRIYGIQEQVQVGLMTGMVAYMAAMMGAIEVGVLMFGVCLVLAFSEQLRGALGPRIGKSIDEWDYLLGSSFFHTRPDPCFVGFLKGVVLAYPRMFGFGDEGEKALFNRLTGQAALICFILIPVDLISAFASAEGFSLGAFIGGTALGIFMSISMLAMYAPAICGSITRYKLLGQTIQLKIAGGVGALASAVGLVLGYMGVGVSL